MKHRFWVGKYESDIQHTDYFIGSITYYGSNQNHNKAFCPSETRISSTRTKDYLHFLRDSIHWIINTYRDVEFIFYNQFYAHEIIKSDAQMQYFITCINPHQIIEILNNKAYTRLWLSNIVNVPPFKLLSKNECDYNTVSRYFPDYTKFVIQQNNSSGGKGTFLLNTDNGLVILDRLSVVDLYLVSPYMENSYSVNLHICITNGEHIIFPPSIQIIRVVDNTLLYSGADYIEAKRIPSHHLESIYGKAYEIAASVSSLGYRGIIGVDFIVTENTIMFIEINPRFQGSSLPLSKTLVSNGYKSIYQIHAEAFSKLVQTDLVEAVKNINVPYSLVQYSNMKTGEFYGQLYSRFFQTKYCEVYGDGYQPDIIPDYSANLYRVLFKTHITYINKDNKINLAENIFDNDIFSLPISSKDDILGLKFALLVQGVRLSKEAKIHISQKSTIKEATFNAIDIEIFHKLIVNCPINIPFVELSPFHIEYDKLNRLQLYFNNAFISDVLLDIEENILDKKTSGGLLYSHIGFRTNDRVRIRHNSVCYYKINGLSCSFCQSKDINPIKLPLKDIFEVIDNYEKYAKFRHYLIGGPLGSEDDEPEKIKNIIKHIRSVSNKPIYLMCLPPKDISHIQDYHLLGLSEIIYNLEIYDRNIAKDIMPGKGCISLEQYLKAFQESTKYFGTSGNVRSMLIVGLEHESSLLAGIQKLCSIGVAPMLSVFRPMPLATMNTIIPENVHALKTLYGKAVQICSQYNLQLGSICPHCQNNTLSISNAVLELLPK